MGGTPASLLTIFGASGDLSQRMLLPSLYGLESAGLLSPKLRILGTARSEYDTEGFRALVADAVRRHVPSGDCHEATLSALLARVEYQAADTSDADSMRALGDRIRALRDGYGR